jgi:hypothetical protein
MGESPTYSLTWLHPLSSMPKMKNHDVSRKQMVEHQIISRGVKDDRVLAAMLKVPRHLLLAGPGIQRPAPPNR